MKFRKLDPNKVSYIFVHCVRDKQDARSLNRDARLSGRLDCGYHFVIDPHGSVGKVRELDEVGDHTRGLNTNSVGIALSGDNFTLDQQAALGALLTLIRPMYPTAVLHSSTLPENINSWARDTGVIE